ncbi:MAG: hypothetical protein GEU79_18455 [Acidimicrobiia bacterium]|nr:hypothetical protein [Acidimicrobiia bacterium]
MSDANGTPVLLWLGFLAIIAVCVTGSLVGFLNPTIILDLIASWPLLGVPAVTVIIVHRLSPKVRGITIPLVMILVTLGALGLHFTGWTWLPSARSVVTVDADPALESAYLELAIAGSLVLGDGGDSVSYSVTPRTIGGSIGPPSITETRTGDSMEVVATVEDADGWVRSDGWTVRLGDGITWSLSTRGRHDADLVDVELDRIRAAGSGSFLLGANINEAHFQGRFRVTVPAARRVVVTGDAVVPEGWSPTEDGWESPGEVGTVLTIRVTPGSTVEVEEA